MYTKEQTEIARTLARDIESLNITLTVMRSAGYRVGIWFGGEEILDPTERLPEHLFAIQTLTIEIPLSDA